MAPRKHLGYLGPVPDTHLTHRQTWATCNPSQEPGPPWRHGSPWAAWIPCDNATIAGPNTRKTYCCGKSVPHYSTERLWLGSTAGSAFVLLTMINTSIYFHQRIRSLLCLLKMILGMRVIENARSSESRFQTNPTIQCSLRESVLVSYGNVGVWPGVQQKEAVSSNMCSFVEGDYEGDELYVHGVSEMYIKNIWCEDDDNIPHLTCPIERKPSLSNTLQSIRHCVHPITRS